MKNRGIATIIFFCLLYLTSILPGYSRITIDGETEGRFRVKPGDTAKGSIFVRNIGNKTSDVKIYQTDYLFDCEGNDTYGDPGNDKRSNARWVTFSPERINIEPGTVAEVRYEINVPKDAELRGVYWSMLMIEDQGEPVDITKIQDGIGIKQIFRFGIQIITSILTNPGNADLSILKLETVKNQDGKIKLNVDLKNTGETLIIPKVYAEIYDFQGKLIGKFDAEQMRIFPETSIRSIIELANLPPGKYKSLIIADGGEDNIFGTRYNFVIEK
jgi:hypothetical protein